MSSLFIQLLSRAGSDQVTRYRRALLHGYVGDRVRELQVAEGESVRVPLGGSELVLTLNDELSEAVDVQRGLFCEPLELSADERAEWTAHLQPEGHARMFFGLKTPERTTWHLDVWTHAGHATLLSAIRVTRYSEQRWVAEPVANASLTLPTAASRVVRRSSGYRRIVIEAEGDEARVRTLGNAGPDATTALARAALGFCPVWAMVATALGSRVTPSPKRPCRGWFAVGGTLLDEQHEPTSPLHGLRKYLELTSGGAIYHLS